MFQHCLDKRGEKGTGYFFIERPTARILEALGAANSTRTNQRAVLVLVVRDINAAARSKRSNRSIASLRSNRLRE